MCKGCVMPSCITRNVFPALIYRYLVSTILNTCPEATNDAKLLSTHHLHTYV